MTTLGEISLDDQLTELRRELRMRERCYPGWVEAGRMTSSEAERQFARLAAAIATLEGLRPPAPQHELFGGPAR